MMMLIALIISLCFTLTIADITSLSDLYSAIANGPNSKVRIHLLYQRVFDS